MNTYRLMAVIAAAAVLSLSAGAAMSESGKAADGKCPYAGPGVSLCGKVGNSMHACVQDKSCDKKSAAKKRAGRSGLGFLGRLFI